MSPFPICMFPTNVVLIDDDQQSFKVVLPNLEDMKSTYQFYDSPESGLNFVNRQYKLNKFSQELITQPVEEDWQHTRLDVNIYDLMQEVYNPHRFDQVSTVVVDFDMPGINGLEVCEKIKDPGIQKILLTGAADTSVAVEAFNKKIIHRYIQKQNPNVYQILNQSIKDAQRAYFTQTSQLMYQAATFEPQCTYLLDPVFISFFENLLKEKRIVEYYLFEITGSFLMIDAASKAYGLFTYNKEQMEMWEDAAQSKEVSNPLYSEIKNLQTMICFHDRNRIELPEAPEWRKYAYPVTKLEGGNQTYYYAFAENMLDLEWDRIVPFTEHKSKFASPYG